MTKKKEINKILEWHNSGTLKTEEATERICALFSVSNHRELLDFLKWYLDNELDFNETDKLEDYVNKYLKSNCC